MKNNFTPGPWVINGNEIQIKLQQDDYAEAWSNVASVESRFGRYNEKDAHLIAAAPDLYKALEKAYIDILNIINQGEFKEGIEWNSGYIEDALKKARGEK